MKLLTVFALTGLIASSLEVQAAVPKKISAKPVLTKNSVENLNPRVFEMLSLPPENRSLAAATVDEKLYKDFVTVAFSESHAMRLRWRALMMAAEAKREKALPDLLKAAAHKQWFMRNAALVAVGEVSEAEAQKLAKKMLKDNALVVRSAAVDILQKNANSEVRDLLWNEMTQKHNYRNSESLWIRAQIVEALSQKPADFELKMFSKLLKDKDVRVQLAAVDGMEKLTGVKLGETDAAAAADGQNKMTKTKLISLWQDYIQKEKLAL